MTPLLLLSLAVLPLLSSSRSILYPRQDSDGDSDDYESGSSASTSVSASNPTTTSGASSSNGTTFQGDGTCFSTMCITASVENNNVNYQLTSRGGGQVGWMAIGWGNEMDGSEMVIVWSNANGDVTLSQRRGSGHDEPHVDSNPSKEASLSSTLYEQNTQGNTAYAFSVPYSGEGRTPIIWAVGPDTPSSSAVDAEVVEHTSEGRMSLDLSQTANFNPHAIVSGERQLATSRPLTSYERMMIAHGLLCTIGFVVLLPVGVLLARLWRTFSHMWFMGHQSIQLYLAGIVIIAGIVLGFVAAEQAGDSHFNDDHKKYGVALLVLYIVQIALGLIIHKFKTKSGKRPPQNYIHAILGLIILGFAFWQVRNGYKEEYPAFTGREVSNAANVIWIIWAAIVVIAYIGGLIFLRKQFRQEKEYRAQKSVQ